MIRGPVVETKGFRLQTETCMGVQKNVPADGEHATLALQSLPQFHGTEKFRHLLQSLELSFCGPRIFLVLRTVNA